MIIIFLLGATF